MAYDWSAIFFAEVVVLKSGDFDKKNKMIQNLTLFVVSFRIWQKE